VHSVETLKHWARSERDGAAIWTVYIHLFRSNQLDLAIRSPPEGKEPGGVTTICFYLCASRFPTDASRAALAMKECSLKGEVHFRFEGHWGCLRWREGRSGPQTLLLHQTVSLERPFRSNCFS
jgi:hypothetical protein